MPSSTFRRTRQTSPRSFRWSIATSTVQSQASTRPDGVLDGCIACDGCGAPVIAPTLRRRSRLVARD